MVIKIKSNTILWQSSNYKKLKKCSRYESSHRFFNVVDNSTTNGLIPKGHASNISSDSDNQNKLIEYVATFPNVTVNTGDEYKTCVLPMKTLKIKCVEGTNSLAKRAEVVDLSLNSITQSPDALTASKLTDSFFTRR